MSRPADAQAASGQGTVSSPPPSQPLSLSPSEPHPEIKGAAGEVAIALATYDPVDTPESIAARLPEEARPIAAALHRPGHWSRARILYPQFGGLRERSASVMVVMEQMVGGPDGVAVTTRALDIRVVRAGGEWRFAALASDGGEPRALPERLVPEAYAVLNDARITLSDSARWDIYDGIVSRRLLGVLSRLAEETPYAIAVFDRGHPWEIFGTDRQSDHSRGRAADIYAVAERLVIDDRAQGSPTHRIAAWLFADPEVARIGSPFLLGGFGSGAFTDDLHQDHLHVAVDE